MCKQIFSTLGANILSSIMYDLGKNFILKDYEPLTEQEVLDIINNIQSDFNEIIENQKNFEGKLDYLLSQNETIIKLLLIIFNENSQVSILNEGDGYYIKGECALSSLSDKTNLCLKEYSSTLPEEIPTTLSEAIWPIPKETKEDLLNEIAKNLYE